MTKEEAIKEAWGDRYPVNGVDEFGFSNDCFERISTADYDFIKVLNGFKIRPKSLQGIENNNCWIKIESEKDLPIKKVNCYYYDINKNYLSDLLERDNSRLKWLFVLGVITHIFIVEPIEKPKPPIY